jgi:hypothetical protein
MMTGCYTSMMKAPSTTKLLWQSWSIAEQAISSLDVFIRLVDHITCILKSRITGKYFFSCFFFYCPFGSGGDVGSCRTSRYTKTKQKNSKKKRRGKKGTPTIGVVVFLFHTIQSDIYIFWMDHCFMRLFCFYYYLFFDPNAFP